MNTRIRVYTLALALLSISVANAQYAASTVGGTTAPAEINGKMNHQEAASGAACAALNGTLGKDQCTDTSTGDIYEVITTGTPATWRRLSVGSVNSQTSTYTAIATDANKLIKMNGSSLTLNLPATPPFAAWKIWVQNLAATDLTISRNSLTINSAASNITLKQYGMVQVWTDGTNYLSSVPLVAGSNITLTPAANGLTIDASSSGSSSIVSYTVTFDGMGTALSGGATRCFPVLGSGALVSIRLQACNGYDANSKCNAAGSATVDIKTLTNGTYAASGPGGTSIFSSVPSISSAYAVDVSLSGVTTSGFGGKTACVVMSSPTAISVDAILGVQ